MTRPFARVLLGLAAVLCSCRATAPAVPTQGECVECADNPADDGAGANASETEPSYVTVEREPEAKTSVPVPQTFEADDPRQVEARVAVEQAKDWGVKDDRVTHAFVADFSRRNRGDELVVIIPGVELEVRSKTTSIAKRPIGSVPDFLPPESTEWTAVRMVDRDRLEIAAVEARTGERGEHAVFVVYKVIGKAVAEVFVQEIARRADQGWVTTASVEYVRSGERRGLHVRPVDSSGTRDNSPGKTYWWNPWEGLFRVPEPPPTAPRR